ncbi:MAG: hypothetical protein OXF41_16115 [bacterium]|nr:hypothetical protein [bacterium]
MGIEHIPFRTGFPTSAPWVLSRPKIPESEHDRTFSWIVDLQGKLRPS